MRKLGIYACAAVFLLASEAQAALVDLGNGLVNDSTLNILWLKDANVFKTLCDADNPLATDFVPVDVLPGVRLCDQPGLMSWNDAEAWIARLNANNYLGHADWRQPLTAQPDPSCSEHNPDGQDLGFRCTGSELGNLFNLSLGNPNDLDDGCYPPSCLVNTGPFQNMQSFGYHSGTVYAPDPSLAWLFQTGLGLQNRGLKFSFGSFVWPVRPGQSAAAAAQAIPSLGVWGLVLSGLLLVGLARRRIRSFG